jgi:hypothetical protein
MEWAGIISDYSFRKLTYASDQFPALAGLESEFGELSTSDRYSNGMWMSRLHPQLLWMQSRSRDLSESASLPASPDWPNTPSWSWASLRAGVIWYPTLFSVGRENYMCSLDTERVTDSDCTLYISGLPLRLHEEDLGGMRPVRAMSSVALPRFSLELDYNLDAWYLHRMFSLASGDKYACLQRVMETTLVFPVLWSTDDKGGHGPECLVLCRDIAFVRGVYRRVGVARMYPPAVVEGVPPSHSQFTKSLEVRAKNLADPDFIRRNEDGTVGIELI